MIIANGTIEFLVSKTGGGLSAQGYPQPAAKVWGAPVPCQYSTLHVNLQGKVQNEPASTPSYSIIIEDTTFETEQLRLTDSKTGKKLGEFSIVQVEPLDAVCQMRITV